MVAGLQFGNVFVGIQPPKGFRGEPDRDLPRPRPPADPPLPRGLLVDDRRVRRRRRRPPRQARHPGVAAGQVARSLALVRSRRRPARRAALLPLRRQRSRRGDAGQAAGARHGRGPPDPPDDPRRDLRRPGEAGATPGRVLPGGDARPLEAARDTGPGSGRPCATPSSTATSASRSSPRSSRTSSPTWTDTSARSKTSPSAAASTSSARPPRASPCATSSPRSCASAPARSPACAAPSASAFGLDERSLAENGGARVEAPPALAERFPGTVATASDLLDRLEEAQQALLLALEARNWDAEAAGTVCEEVLGVADAGVVSSPAVRRRRGRAAPRCARRRRWGTCSPGSGAGTCRPGLPAPRRAGW